jgi:hypothetical protein
MIRSSMKGVYMANFVFDVHSAGEGRRIGDNKPGGGVEAGRDGGG